MIMHVIMYCDILIKLYCTLLELQLILLCLSASRNATLMDITLLLAQPVLH